eukprot:1020047-Karenia_brevis.AAC.1
MDSEEFIILGWTAQHTAGNPSAVLIPDFLNGAVVWMGSHRMHSFILLGSIGIVSTYLPDCSKGLT